MKILFVGDVVGKVGRRVLKQLLPRVISELSPDFVVVNVENAAGGFGLTAEVWKELASLPVDVFTSGNHIWDKKETASLLDHEPRLLRPANSPRATPDAAFVCCPADKTACLWRCSTSRASPL
jgi:calcineurin-like phosphoesterase